MIRNDFCVLILSHGRADKVVTLKALEKSGYTGPTYIVCDNTDKKLDEYKAKFGDKVVVFDKPALKGKYDTGDLGRDMRVVIYARNMCWPIAEKLGYKYFLMLDDDYSVFEYRKVKEGTLKHITAHQLDLLFNLMIDFLEVSKAKTVCLAQGGDFLGGEKATLFRKRISHKAMNTFFCKTSNPFQFIGNINEDVNTYVTFARRGELMFTVADALVQQVQTQKNSGGLTEIYLDKGTYLKSFYSVLFEPSAVKIGVMGEKHKRIHHKVSWNNCVPKILSSKYQKWS